MQWKKTETNGLKTEICPRKVHELAAFGNYLIELAKKIKFQTIRNHFQKRLQQDIKTIKKKQIKLLYLLTNPLTCINLQKSNMINGSKFNNHYIQKANKSTKKIINKKSKQILKENTIIKHM